MSKKKKEKKNKLTNGEELTAKIENAHEIASQALRDIKEALTKLNIIKKNLEESLSDLEAYR
jgi:DNA-directed RNA polymerase subunit K/omega